MRGGWIAGPEANADRWVETRARGRVREAFSFQWSLAGLPFAILLAVRYPFLSFLPAYLLFRIGFRAAAMRRLDSWAVGDPAYPLLELPGAPRHPVALTLRRQRRLLGRDEGVIQFEGGWLLFEGLLTRFSIRAIDLSGEDPYRCGDVEIRIRPLHPSLGFRQEMAAFLRTGGLPQGEPVLPPDVRREGEKQDSAAPPLTQVDS